MTKEQIEQQSKNLAKYKETFDIIEAADRMAKRIVGSEDVEIQVCVHVRPKDAMRRIETIKQELSELESKLKRGGLAGLLTSKENVLAELNKKSEELVSILRGDDVDDLPIHGVDSKTGIRALDLLRGFMLAEQERLNETLKS